MNSRPRRTHVGPDEFPRLPVEDRPDDQYDTPLEFDDGPWEAFLPDDEPSDPLPEPGDFWIEPDQLNAYSRAA